jgi:hypothetical protein
VAYLGAGKSCEKGGSFSRPVAFICREERERGVVWSRTSATGRRRRAGPAEPGTDGSASVGISNLARVQMVLGRTAHGPGLLNLMEFVNYENHPSAPPKFTRLCNLIE